MNSIVVICMHHILSFLYLPLFLAGSFSIAFKEALPFVGADAHRYDCFSKGQCDENKNMFDETCATIQLFRKITKQSRPWNVKGKACCTFS